MVSQLTGKAKLSWEISMALDVAGYNPEMMRWRQTHYDMRSKMFVTWLSDPLRDFGTAKVKIYLTGGKRDGSSIWSRGDEDLMVVFDRYVCVDDHRLVEPRTAETEYVYFQIEDIQNNPGYVYLTKCPLTKLDLVNSAFDRLINTMVNENGYLSSQRLNKIFYETCKTSEKQIKDLIGKASQPGMLSFMANKLGVAESSLQSFMKTRLFSFHYNRSFFETKDEEYPNIIVSFKGYQNDTIDVLLGAFNCIYSKDRLQVWAKMQRPHGWPSSSVIDQVLEMPVHIVPKGCKGSENRALEFRMSYVLGEITLMKSLNDTQSKLFVLLKLLVKSTMDTGFPDIITSYCLKNVVFWICERNPKTMFDNGSLLVLLESSLEFMRDCIRDEKLPMYLMPERNLLEGKIHNRNKDELIVLLTELLSGVETVVFESIPLIKAILDVIRQDPVLAIAIAILIRRGEMWLVNDRMETINKHIPFLVQKFMNVFYENLQKKSKQV